MRPLKELLALMLNHMSANISEAYYMCILLKILRNSAIISEDEYNVLHNHIFDNRPRKGLHEELSAFPGYSSSGVAWWSIEDYIKIADNVHEDVINYPPSARSIIILEKKKFIQKLIDEL